MDIYATSNPLRAELASPDSLRVYGGSGIKVNDWYVLRHKVYGLNAVTFENVTDAQLVDIQLFSTAGMGFYMGHVQVTSPQRSHVNQLSITTS